MEKVWKALDDCQRRMTALIEKAAEATQAAKLQEALGITEDQYKLFFAMAHQAQSKQKTEAD